MKKLILFFVLILGFVSGIKAQFPASSDIYYYVDIDPHYSTNGELIVHCYKFYSDRVVRIVSSIYTLNDLNNLKFEHVFFYNEKVSNHKYFVYSKVERIGVINYNAISKDREEVITWLFYNGKTYSKDYYKRVTINEIKALLKPQFDFLE